MPTQILEVRFEADTPEDAINTIVESVTADGLDVQFIGSIH